AGRALDDMLSPVQKVEVYGNKPAEVDTEFEPYIPQQPKIVWNSPIPRDAKEEAEIMSLRTGGKPTLDVHSAIKRQAGFDDDEAEKVIARIDADDERANQFVDASIFNALEPAEGADE